MARLSVRLAVAVLCLLTAAGGATAEPGGEGGAEHGAEPSPAKGEWHPHQVRLPASVFERVGRCPPQTGVELLKEYFGNPETNTPDPKQELTAIRARYALDYLIATVPETSHGFDGAWDAIEYALEDMGYTQDVYSLPWALYGQKQDDKTGAAPPRPASATAGPLDGRTASAAGPAECHPGDYPGVVLLRQGPPELPPEGDRLQAAAGRDGRRRLLLVFLVEENPTFGLNKSAFSQAMAQGKQALSWMGVDDSTAAVKVLGPTYSGSATSLRVVLDRYPGRSFRVISGSATDRTIQSELEGPAIAGLRCASAEDETACRSAGSGAPQTVPPETVQACCGCATVHDARRGCAQSQISFQSTALPNDVIEERFYEYLVHHLGADLHEAALLVEGSTVYGQSTNHRSDVPCCKAEDIAHCPTCDRPRLTLTVPMHVANLHKEWERADKTTGGPDQSGPGGLDPKTSVHDSLSHAATDSVASEFIPTFSRSSLSSESHSLEDVLTAIYTEKIRYVGIIVTEVEDKIFLAEQIRQFCPDVQIFTFEGDLDLTRPSDIPALRGMLVASSYPLFSRNQQWSYPQKGHQRRRQFARSADEGMYNATAALLGEDRLILEYSPVLFKSKESPEAVDLFPQVWISAVGRDTLFPLAALNPLYSTAKRPSKVHTRLAHWTRQFVYSPGQWLTGSHSPRAAASYDQSGAASAGSSRGTSGSGLPSRAKAYYYTPYQQGLLDVALVLLGLLILWHCLGYLSQGELSGSEREGPHVKIEKLLGRWGFWAIYRNEEPAAVRWSAGSGHDLNIYQAQRKRKPLYAAASLLPLVSLYLYLTLIQYIQFRSSATTDCLALDTPTRLLGHFNHAIFFDAKGPTSVVALALFAAMVLVVGWGTILTALWQGIGTLALLTASALVVLSACFGAQRAVDCMAVALLTYAAVVVRLVLGKNLLRDRKDAVSYLAMLALLVAGCLGMAWLGGARGNLGMVCAGVAVALWLGARHAGDWKPLPWHSRSRAWRSAGALAVVVLAYLTYRGLIRALDLWIEGDGTDFSWLLFLRRSATPYFDLSPAMPFGMLCLVLHFWAYNHLERIRLWHKFFNGAGELLHKLRLADHAAKSGVSAHSGKAHLPAWLRLIKSFHGTRRTSPAALRGREAISELLCGQRSVILAQLKTPTPSRLLSLLALSVALIFSYFGSLISLERWELNWVFRILFAFCIVLVGDSVLRFVLLWRDISRFLKLVSLMPIAPALERMPLQLARSLDVLLLDEVDEGTISQLQEHQRQLLQNHLDLLPGSAGAEAASSADEGGAPEADFDQQICDGVCHFWQHQPLYLARPAEAPAEPHAATGHAEEARSKEGHAGKREKAEEGETERAEAPPCSAADSSFFEQALRETPDLLHRVLRMAEEYLAMQVVACISTFFPHLRRLLLFSTLGLLLLLGAITAYPFQPHHILMMLIWILILSSVSIMMATLFTMNRDDALSRITKTEPGKVTWSRPFITNLVVYGLVPILSLLAAQLPSVGSVVFSWVEPVLRILK